MGAVLWLLLGLVQLIGEIRRYGQAGRARFRQLDEPRARAVHEMYVSNTIPFLNTYAIALSVLGVVFAAADGSAVRAALWGAAAALLFASLGMRTKVKPTILEDFEERGLAPLLRRDSGAKRGRRQRQFGTIALLGILFNEVATYLAERWDQPGLHGVAAISVLVAIVGGGALLGSTVWVYG